MATVEKIKGKHDFIFWLVLACFLGMLLGFLSGCSADCGCDYPELTQEDDFEIIAWNHFKSPRYGIQGKEGEFIEAKLWDIYKIKYEGHYYIVWGRPGSSEGYSVTLDPVHESGTATLSVNLNNEYLKLFGK